MKKTLLLSALCVSLVACTTAPKEFGYGDPVKPMTKKEKMVMSARNAIIEKQVSSIARGELTLKETMYRQNPKNSKAALEYASLLRKVGMVEQAQMILKPFAINPDNQNDDLLVEYAKIQLKQGEFDAAQVYAQEAMMLSDTAQARMVLGVSVDAQGHHQAAENHFRVALDKANLDMDLQNVIKNNLALSLIAQNKNTEAQSILNSIGSMPSDLDADVVNANKNLSSKL